MIYATPFRKPLSYGEYCHEFQPASILLWERGVWLSQRVIAASGRCVFSHGEMLDANGFFSHSLGFTMWGPHDVPLYPLVQKYPGRIHLYEPNPGVAWAHGCSWDGQAAVSEMRAIVDNAKGYGWYHLGRLVVFRFPLIRLFLVYPKDDRSNGTRLTTYFCSHACSWATRAGGFDPVRHVPDHLTEPADFARSWFYSYKGALVP